MNPIPKAQPMPEIDIGDDDALRFIQRVLEGDPPQSDKNAAAQMVRDIRTRVRKAYAAGVKVLPDAPMSRESESPRTLFATSVASGKWFSLQQDGYRMQRIYFARSIDGHERRGSIDPWGKVLWEPDGVAIPRRDQP